MLVLHMTLAIYHELKIKHHTKCSNSHDFYYATIHPFSFLFCNANLKLKIFQRQIDNKHKVNLQVFVFYSIEKLKTKLKTRYRRSKFMRKSYGARKTK